MKGEGNSPGTAAHSLSGGPQGLQAAEQPGLTLTADSPNHHLPHLLGHHASWGSWPLLWGLIVVRVIWGEKWVGGDLEARSLASPSRPLDPWAWLHKGHPQPQTPTPTGLAFKRRHRGQEMLFILLGPHRTSLGGAWPPQGGLKRWQAWGSGAGTIQNSNMN